MIRYLCLNVVVTQNSTVPTKYVNTDIIENNFSRMEITKVWEMYGREQ